MRIPKVELSAAAVLAALFVMAVYSSQARSAGQPQGGATSPPGAAAQHREDRTPVDVWEEDPIEWPVPAADRAYGTIDGKHMWQYVVEQVAISRNYRDHGHPQFWGRIIGTSGDAESAQWLLDRFNKNGMTDTHIQPVDLEPQWMAQSWDVSVIAGGKATPLGTAQPAYATPGTQAQGLDLEAVYVGLGREAEFAGRDVHGKAVFVFFSNEQADALKRAEAKGAAAIFAVNLLPGDLKFQSYPVNTNVPSFNVSLDDGQAVRTLIEQAAGGQAPHVKIRLDVQMVPNLKTALVWGTLPGATDETIYVIAHRDGWFDAAGDNAGGVASMVGLANYFSKIPKERRRRTMVFIGIDGHHNTGPGGAAGGAWLVAHRPDLFTKTALMLNDEHPSDVEDYMYGRAFQRSDTYFPLQWYAGGSSRPALTKIAADAFREFGVSIWSEPSPTPPAGDLGQFSEFLPGVVSQANRFFYFHTDANMSETVPWTGLEAVTRAYAKIIDQVNKIDLKDLQRPEETPANSRRE